MSRRTVFLIAAIIVTAIPLAGCPPKVVYNDVSPDYQLTFPEDHYAHTGYRVEWWYFTGHLESESGDKYGFELVFFKKRSEGDFRLGLPVWWFQNPAYVAHFAVTDLSKRSFQYSERIGVNKPLRGGASTDKLVIWNEDWSAMEMGDTWYLNAAMPGYAMDLFVQSNKPPVMHGENGYSQKSEQGGASYYVSLTSLAVQGILEVDGTPLAVTGKAWMDHEVLSAEASQNIIGWDWFSIQLDNDHELMLFTVRTEDGSIDPYSSGTIVFPDGTYEHFYSDHFEIRNLSYWTSTESRVTYPSSWKVSVPEYDINLTLLPVLGDQELRPWMTQIIYWEGAVEVQGTFMDETVTGEGYVELSGYHKPIRL